MNAFQRKEARLKSELEEAADVDERRRIRTELRELRQSVKGESEAVDLNANSIPYRQSPAPIETTRRTNTESLRLNDTSDEVRHTSADERQARRDRRKDRQSRLARETEEEKTTILTAVRKDRDAPDVKQHAPLARRVDVLNNNVTSTRASVGAAETTSKTSVSSRFTSSIQGDGASANGFLKSSSTSHLGLRPTASTAEKKGPTTDVKAKDRVGRALSVGMMRDKFGAMSQQSGNSKPVEFGTSYIKPTAAKQADPVAPAATTAPKASPFKYSTQTKSATTWESRSSLRNRDDSANNIRQETKLISNAAQQKQSADAPILVQRTTRTEEKVLHRPESSRAIYSDKPTAKPSEATQVASAEKPAPSHALKRTPSQLISAALDKKMYTPRQAVTTTAVEANNNNNNNIQPKNDVKSAGTIGTTRFESKAEPAKPGKLAGLRQTFDNQNQSYKKETPTPKVHHPTAPAGSSLRSSASFSYGTSSGSSTRAEDRLRYFREAAEKEKARKERLKAKNEPKLTEEDEATAKKQDEEKNTEAPPRERLSSAPAAINDTAKDARSAAPCMKKREQKRPVRRTMSISSIVLDWCKEMVRDYGIQVKNFSSSWNDGMAFCALIHHFHPDAFDFNELSAVNRERNFTLAFETAYNKKNVPMLLDVVDMVNMPNPEPRSVQCYIQWIWSVYGPISGYGPSHAEIQKANAT